VRPDAYTSHERGQARKAVGGFWAFFPAETPRRLSLSDEVVKLLDEAIGAVHRLGGVGRLIPNPHLLIGPHLRLEAVLSSRIEGTRTDVGQLLRGTRTLKATVDGALEEVLALDRRRRALLAERGVDVGELGDPAERQGAWG
jgi:hypothetical protein